MERVNAVDIKSAFLGDQTIEQLGPLVSGVVHNVLILSGVVTFVLLILGGFAFIVGAGAGDTKQLEQAKKTITGAVIGLLVVVGSFWIVQIIETLTGMKGQLLPQ